MSDATEDRINLIRNDLIDAVKQIYEFQINEAGWAPELVVAGQKIEDVLVEFERLVHELTEAK